jgi:hypothetical protein
VPYRVLISRVARAQLRGAPPLLLGYVDGILAVLRVDPDAATAAFDIRVSNNGLREALSPAAEASSTSGSAKTSRSSLSMT